ncbi:hypothetical protein D3C74_418310 [compost metagenome]
MIKVRRYQELILLPRTGKQFYETMYLLFELHHQCRLSLFVQAHTIFAQYQGKKKHFLILVLVLQNDKHTAAGLLPHDVTFAVTQDDREKHLFYSPTKIIH